MDEDRLIAAMNELDGRLLDRLWLDGWVISGPSTGMQFRLAPYEERSAYIVSLAAGEDIPVHLKIHVVEQRHPAQLSKLRIRKVMKLEIVERQELVMVFGESREIVV